MSKYRITDIENFVSTSECRTIVEAAQKLGISQPALSESIKCLESDLGVILFYRSRTGIQMTPSGRDVLKKANRVVNSLAALGGADSEANIFSGKAICIGCHSTVAQYIMPKAIAYILKKAPDYRLNLVHDLSRNIQIEVQRGKIDVAIVINPAEVPDIVIRKMASDVIKVWCAKKNFDKSTVICNPALTQTQHILRNWKSKPPRVIETDSFELIGQLAGAGLGYGIMPERAVGLLGLKLSEATGLPSYIDQICLVHRPEFGANKAEKLVCEGIKASLFSAQVPARR